MGLQPPIESLLAKAIREAREKEERERRLNVLGAPNLFPTILGRKSILTPPPKRKVFISYHHDDEDEVEDFVNTWAYKQKVFIPKALGAGVSDEDDFIDSSNPSYVMSKIREKYLQDSSVTIVLIGLCTHSRRYVDWELKASLTQGENSLPNGLIGILLPSQGGKAHLPPRFRDNWNPELRYCYARYHSSPTSSLELRGWIEDAYRAKTIRAKHIKNSSDMMKYNAECNVCKVTH